MGDQDKSRILLNKDRGGDQGAFRDMIEVHLDRLKALIHSRLRAHIVHPSEVEDI